MEESEVRLAIVSLLLKSPMVEHASNSDIIERADSLTSFILNGTQEVAPKSNEPVIDLIIEDLNSQGRLAHALEKWILRNERFLSRWSSNHRM